MTLGHGLVRWLLLAAALFTTGVAPTSGLAQTVQDNIQLKEVQVAADSFSLGDAVPAWVEPVAVPETTQTQATVIRLADTQFLVAPTPVVFVHRAVLINDAASLSSAGQISIPFVPQYQKLKLHMLRVLRGGESADRAASSSIRFLQRETDLEQGVYSGEVTASVLVSDLRVGDTLEFAYSRHGQNPVFGDRFSDTASWDQGPPAELRRIALTHPADRRIAWRLLGGPRAKAVQPTETIEDGRRRLVFEERSIGKVTVESSTPPDYPAYRRLQFSEYAGWDEVSAWASGLFQRQGQLSQELRELVERLRHKPTVDERVVGALEFVQSEIRYFSVSLGESSHRPTQPDTVLVRRYGDCKDKSLLLSTLLGALGIENRPVLLTIGTRRGLDRALPSPRLFNHAIVQVTVNGKAFYLDPTLLGQSGKLEQIGQVHEGAQVLVVGPQTRQLTTIASQESSSLVRNEIIETATLAKFDADAQLHVRQVWRGAAAERLRLAYARMPREDLLRLEANALEQRYPGAKLIGEPEVTDDRPNNVFSLTKQYTVPKMATDREGSWLVRYQPSNMRGILSTPPAAGRTVPLELPAYPYQARYSFEIRFPDEVSIFSDPRVTSVSNKHFNYNVRTSFRGNTFRTSIEFAALVDRVEPADLAAYGEGVRSLSAIGSNTILLPKTAIRSAKVAAKKDVTQTLRDRLQETIDKTTKAIQSQRLASADLASSYCLRSGARSDLGMAKDALADANEAVKLAPNSSEALRCRAYAQFNSGEFDKTVSDYSKSIALGATDAKILQYRGIAKFYAGKLDEAAQDFLRASETGDRDSQLFGDLWLAWTLLRLGRPLPDDLVARAGAEARGDWPRPALAMLAGKVSPEEMLKLIERKAGDERKMALAEGYFYLGQYHMSRGDKAKARELFEKTRRLNIVIFIEHTAAGFELQTLGPSAAPTARAPAPATDARAPSPAAGTATGSIGDGGPAAPAPAVARPPANKPPAKKPPGKAGEPWPNEIWKR